MTLATLAGQGSAQLPLTPAGHTSIAAADAVKLGPTAVYARYLSLYNVRGAKDKRLAWEVLSAHVNRLSLQPLIVPPVLILEDGSVRYWPLVAPEDWEHLALLRLDLLAYGWKVSTYDKLATLDPFFHTPLVEVDEMEEVGHYETAFGQRCERQAPGARWVRTGERKTGKKTRATKKVAGLAPWLAETAAQQLALDALDKATQCQAPILRADNFHWQTDFQFGQEVGYYGIQEIKSQKDFERLVGFNRKDVGNFSPGFLAAVANSGVSRAARRIEVQDKIGGDRLATFDNDHALDKANPLRILDERNFTFKATEVFAHGSNGLWKVLLADNLGKLQDSAPDFIGFNHNARGNDGKIHVGVTCFTCHDKGGVQPIKDWARHLFRPPLQLTSPDPQVFQDLANAYVRKIDARLPPARNRYALALLECNGLTPEKDSAQLADYWELYADRPRTLADVVCDTGVPEADVTRLVVAYVAESTRRGIPFDTVVGMWARPKADQIPQPQEAYDEAFPILQATLRGVALPPVKP